MKNKFLLRFSEEDTDPNPTPTDPAPKANGEDSNKGDKRYTDEDVNRIIDRKFAEWSKKQKEASDEATRLASMNETQRLEHEKQKLQEELDKLNSEKARNELIRVARSSLSEAQVSVPDSIIESLVKPTADETKVLVDGFIAAFQKAVSDAVKEALKGGTPRVSGAKGKTLTKKDISAVKDPIERRRLIAENIDLYRNKKG